MTGLGFSSPFDRFSAENKVLFQTEKNLTMTQLRSALKVGTSPKTQLPLLYLPLGLHLQSHSLLDAITQLKEELKMKINAVVAINELLLDFEEKGLALYIDAPDDEESTLRAILATVITFFNERYPASTALFGAFNIPI